MLSQLIQNIVPQSLLVPPLKISVTSLVRWVARGHIFPWRSCSANPQNSVNNFSGILSKKPALRLGVFREKFANIFPLAVGQVHLFEPIYCLFLKSEKTALSYCSRFLRWLLYRFRKGLGFAKPFHASIYSTRSGLESQSTSLSV